MTASLLLLTSAMFHALWNAWIKRDGEPRINTMGVLVVALVTSSLVIPFAPGPTFRDIEGVWWTLAAGICEGGYFLTLALSLEQAPLGRAYTVMRGGAMVFVWVISALLGFDAVTGLTLVGVLCVLYGLILTNLTPKKEGAQGRVHWAWVCAGFITAFHFFYSRALAHGAMPFALFSVSLLVGLPVYFAVSGRAVARQFLKKLTRRPAPFIVGGLVCALSFLVFLHGLSISKPGIAITLRNTSVVFAQVFALAIGERVSRRQWAGAILVSIGAICIGWKP